MVIKDVRYSAARTEKAEMRTRPLYDERALGQGALSGPADPTLENVKKPALSVVSRAQKPISPSIQIDTRRRRPLASANGAKRGVQSAQADRFREDFVPIIDPNKNPVGCTRRLQGETDPRHRRMLEEVRFHIAVEAACDVGPAIERLAPNPEYVVFNHAGQPTVIRGRADIRAQFYDPLFENVDPRLEWDIVRCLVEGDCVVTEGKQKQALRGAVLRREGFDVDPDGLYLQYSQHLVVWPFDAQLRLIGETVYMGYSSPLEDVAKSPLAPEDIGSYAGEIFELA